MADGLSFCGGWENRGKVLQDSPDPGSKYCATCCDPDADAIATHVVATAKPGDVICVLSNGGFGGVLEKLLVGLKA